MFSLGSPPEAKGTKLLISPMLLNWSAIGPKTKGSNAIISAFKGISVGLFSPS